LGFKVKWIGVAALMALLTGFATMALLMGCATHYVRRTDNGLSFYLKAPSAGQVEILASFNYFSPLPAERVAPATWKVTMPSNTSFSYFYRIDGSIHVPDCDLQEKDDFGQSNCIYEKSP
jgi:hypothetical protein